MQQLDRSQGIGCSDLPVIMGVSPWSNPYKLWEEKVFGKSEQLDNPAMKYGRETEPLIRELVENKLDLCLPSVRLIHPQKSWLWASLDGYDEEAKIIAEFKTANKEDHLTAISGKAPEKYWPQIQGQMEVTGLDSILYCSYHEGDIEIVKIEKDEAYCKLLMEKAEAFWECVVLETPPEGYVCMKDNQTWNHLAEQLDAIKGQIKQFKRQEQEICDKLKEESKGKSARGESLFFQKQECEGAVDYERAFEDYLSNMKTHYPDIVFPDVAYEAYRKKSFEKWVLKNIYNK